MRTKIFTFGAYSTNISIMVIYPQLLLFTINAPSDDDVELEIQVADKQIVIKACANHTKIH